MSNDRNFVQLCVWPGTTLLDATPKEFEDWMASKDGLEVRIKFECEVKTLPDLDDFEDPIPDTGGRSDLFFYVHVDDQDAFAIKRIPLGIRWWEDVIKYNKGSRHLYTPEFIKKYPTRW